MLRKVYKKELAYIWRVEFSEDGQGHLHFLSNAALPNSVISDLWNKAAGTLANTAYWQPFRYSVKEAVNYFWKAPGSGKAPVKPPDDWKGNLNGNSLNFWIKPQAELWLEVKYGWRKPEAVSTISNIIPTLEPILPILTSFDCQPDSQEEDSQDENCQEEVDDCPNEEVITPDAGFLAELKAIKQKTTLRPHIGDCVDCEGFQALLMGFFPPLKSYTLEFTLPLPFNAFSERLRGRLYYPTGMLKPRLQAEPDELFFKEDG
ncbi:hypothetical protein AYO44_10535 [Planctomycetaceae bacterium SCGC AG-212-F19]|nr:hypothetical protein AYO44_10535 [Planctomycetaceae bacterium SCGC AG-212-F19]